MSDADDQVIADIRNATAQLNAALHEAFRAGLSTNVSTQSTGVVGRHAERTFVSVRIRRVISELDITV